MKTLSAYTTPSGKFNHIAVVMGGLSREREVSLSSGEGIVKALTKLGYRVSPIDMERDIANVLTTLKPDAVFNALHGTYGEDGCLPGLLEIMNIPYTHSGVLASSIALHKSIAITLFTGAGISCPKGVTLSRDQVIANLNHFKKPFVIKPTCEGSSIGVVIVRRDDPTPTEKDIIASPEFLVEDYIEGIELSVAVTDEGPLGVIELEPISDFYDYDHKYKAGQTRHYMPARIDKKSYDSAMKMAYLGHTLLGCKTISRSDFRFDPKTGTLYMMELNTHPGMTPLSLVPEIAAHQNVSFEQLVLYITENASCGR